MSFFKKLKEKITKQADTVTEKFKEGLTKTRDSFSGKVNDLVARYRKVDEEFFEELVEILIQADEGFPRPVSSAGQTGRTDRSAEGAHQLHRLAHHHGAL